MARGKRRGAPAKALQQHALQAGQQPPAGQDAADLFATQNAQVCRRKAAVEGRDRQGASAAGQIGEQQTVAARGDAGGQQTAVLAVVIDGVEHALQRGDSIEIHVDRAGVAERDAKVIQGRHLAHALAIVEVFQGQVRSEANNVGPGQRVADCRAQEAQVGCRRSAGNFLHGERRCGQPCFVLQHQGIAADRGSHVNA